jgi:hypothetical protein
MGAVLPRLVLPLALLVEGWPLLFPLRKTSRKHVRGGLLLSLLCSYGVASKGEVNGDADFPSPDRCAVVLSRKRARLVWDGSPASSLRERCCPSHLRPSGYGAASETPRHAVALA